MAALAATAGWPARLGTGARRHPAIVFGLVLLAIFLAMALFAPWLGTVDPTAIRPRLRLRPPSAGLWLGTDAYGRDLWSRVVYGARVSLVVGGAVAVLSLGIGLAIGLVSGTNRTLDAVVMRIMDGMMAIPAILLAIALVGLLGASLTAVIAAITLPEIPRVARLARGVILTVRQEAYVEAAISMGTMLPVIMVRHVLPNILAPVVVQGTYIASSAILIEAALSFLGIGTPSEIPSWGNIMAEGRTSFQLAPWLILAPGLCVALTVLAINRLGDGLRDLLDPRLAQTVRTGP